MNQPYVLEPSEVPIHSNMWTAREPERREFVEEFSNLYRLVEKLRERVNELEELVVTP